MFFQQTLRSPASLSGVGLHSGHLARVRFLPAETGSGVVFRRVDLTPVVEIPGRSEFVTATMLATVLGKDDHRISTVEHCMAALAGMGVDNAVVEVDGSEMPILDGSALPYVEAIQRAGLRQQRGRRQAMRVEKPLRVECGDKFSILRPAATLRITYSIDFDGGFPGSQHYYAEVTPESFASELAIARTFGFIEEIERLRSHGKARGASLQNAVGLREGRVLNPEGLRVPDEFVRHKILDAVGDLALSGFPVLGHLIVHKGGHALHDRLVKELLARPDAWSLVELDDGRPRFEPSHPPMFPVAPAHA